MSGLFKSTLIKGTRITDFARTSASVGNVIPRVYGRARVDGNVIFAALPPKENRQVKRQGKGGVKQETFAYTTSYAIAFAQGPIYGFWWIKRNGKVVYSQDPNAPIEDQEYAAKWAAQTAMYMGSADQLPSSLIESYKGSGQVSAFRYLSYITRPHEDVTDGGGAIPSYEAVVIGTPPEAYLTSHPYPVQEIEAARFTLEPMNGLLRQIMFEGLGEASSAEFALVPVSGFLRSIYQTGDSQDSAASFTLTPQTGLLRQPLQTGDSQDSAASFTLTPQTGLLRTQLYFGDSQDSAASFTLTPQTGTLS